jgi:peptide/nickel transport system substrate-binding protein
VRFRTTLRRRRTALAAAAILAAASLAACSGSGTAKNDSGSPILTVANGQTGQFTRNFNPIPQTANTPTYGMIYEPLLFFNQGKAGDIQPWLATSYKLSADGRTATFQLDPRAKWSDGQPLTAEDVAYTYQLAKDDPKLNTGGLEYEAIKVLGAHEVSITTKAPLYTELWSLAGRTYIIPKHIWEKVKDPSTYQNPNPVGSGAFMLKSFSSQTYTVVKNPRYWQPGKPQIGGLRFVMYGNNTATLTALNAKKLDWAGLFVPQIEKVYASKDPHNKYINTPLFVTELTANTKAFPTDQAPVRKAISLAVDRAQLNKLAFSGYSPPAGPSFLSRRDQAKYLDPQVGAASLKADAAGAAQVLADAGWKKGSDGILRDGQGRKLTITAKVVTGWSDFINALQVIQQELKPIGIDFQPQEVSYASLTADRNNGKFQMLIDNAYGGPQPYQMFKYLFSKKLYRPVGENAPGNYARFTDPAIDTALETIESTNDEAKLKPAYAAIQKVSAAQLPYIPLVYASSLTEYRDTRVTGFPTADNLYAIPEIWQAPDSGYVAMRLKPVK